MQTPQWKTVHRNKGREKQDWKQSLHLDFPEVHLWTAAFHVSGSQTSFLFFCQVAATEAFDYHSYPLSLSCKTLCISTTVMETEGSSQELNQGKQSPTSALSKAPHQVLFHMKPTLRWASWPSPPYNVKSHNHVMWAVLSWRSRIWA